METNSLNRILDTEHNAIYFVNIRESCREQMIFKQILGAWMCLSDMKDEPWDYMECLFLSVNHCHPFYCALSSRSYFHRRQMKGLTFSMLQAS